MTAVMTPGGEMLGEMAPLTPRLDNLARSQSVRRRMKHSRYRGASDDSNASNGICCASTEMYIFCMRQ
jgi:hypothetical protein